ncbi:nucleotidyltransferase family protein [Spiractinospora alimapuensis]|uniref:nucleotidyltransferase family protein n=1 Tax=Spiractinospora alimapuensis TaxID=2820884 RepID=UPI001F2EEDA7|nr:nucleotidyltransferase family protein [Spiractinospora alimapuensis]QVQ51997.1 nucleotidyltransferase family protein [Spiractinospora alimapuensis]
MSASPEPPAREAVILAGGRATRLRPYTDTRPKAMVEIAGRPIIDYQLEWLASYGVEHVVVSCGHMADVLRGHLEETTGDRHPRPETTVVVEEEPLGRGGGLRYAAGALRDPNRAFYALNGDVLTWFPLDDFSAFHTKHGGTVSVALAAFRTSWGIVDAEESGRIRGFTQSPILPYWINAGIYLAEPELVGLLPERGDHETTTFPELAQQGRLFGYRIEGFWRGVDTVKDVEEASAQIALLEGTAHDLRGHPTA